MFQSIVVFSSATSRPGDWVSFSSLWLVICCKTLLQIDPSLAASCSAVVLSACSRRSHVGHGWVVAASSAPPPTVLLSAALAAKPHRISAGSVTRGACASFHGILLLSVSCHLTWLQPYCSLDRRAGPLRPPPGRWCCSVFVGHFKQSGSFNSHRKCVISWCCWVPDCLNEGSLCLTEKHFSKMIQEQASAAGEGKWIQQQ